MSSGGRNAPSSTTQTAYVHRRKARGKGEGLVLAPSSRNIIRCGAECSAGFNIGSLFTRRRGHRLKITRYVSADTALKHVSSTWRVRTPRSSVWSFYLTRRPACSHAPCCHQVNRMTKRMCGHTRFVIMIHPQHHCCVHARYLMHYDTHRRRSVTFPSIPSHF